VPCVFADGWPTVVPVSLSSGLDYTHILTERLEEILYRTGVSGVLLGRLLLNAYCKDVSMFPFGISFANTLPGDDDIAEDTLVVPVKHQDCTCSTTEQSMSTRVTKI
jgi:hypothetical protein